MKKIKLTFLQPRILCLEFLQPESRQDFHYEERVVTPTDADQIIVPRNASSALSKVTVKKIPQYYGKITWDGEKLIIE